MSKSDVIVIGSGPAGLTAACSAAARGRKVTIISAGSGTLASCGDSIDFLGYTKGNPVTTPWDALDNLNKNHPYTILGKDKIESAFNAITQIAGDFGWPCIQPNNKQNRYIPTIAGTLKPTWFAPLYSGLDNFVNAQNILVLGFNNFKDCNPRLIARQLALYPALSHKKFIPAFISMPLQNRHRSLTVLDIARFLDTKDGLEWMCKQIQQFSGNYDAALIPPVCGTHANKHVWETLSETLHAPLIEMASPPPGVGGLRLREIFLDYLSKRNVAFVENAKISGTYSQQKICKAVFSTENGEQRSYDAEQFIIATGGILGGGITANPVSLREEIFNIPINIPDTESSWTHKDIYAPHAIAMAGVTVDETLRATASDKSILFENVRFVGRTLGGYDYCSEKSGLGVSIATGWNAGQMV